MALNLKKTPSKAGNATECWGPVWFSLYQCVCVCTCVCVGARTKSSMQGPAVRCAEETPAEALAEKRRKVGALDQSSYICQSWWLCSGRGSSIGAKVRQKLSINVVIEKNTARAV